MLVVIIFWSFKVIAQEPDTTLYHRMNPDTIIVAVFPKALFDSVQRGYKGPEGYCPPKSVRYYRILKK
jgi:hypothetical protein